MLSERKEVHCGSFSARGSWFFVCLFVLHNDVCSKDQLINSSKLLSCRVTHKHTQHLKAIASLHDYLRLRSWWRAGVCWVLVLAPLPFRLTELKPHPRRRGSPDANISTGTPECASTQAYSFRQWLAQRELKMFRLDEQQEENLKKTNNLYIYIMQVLWGCFFS